MNDGNAEVAHRVQCVGIGVEFNGRDLFAHFVQFKRDAIAEMSQPYEDYMIFHCGRNSHFPFLTARAAIK